VGFIDDDEQLAPAWFEVAYRELSTSPEVDYIGGPNHPNWEYAAPDWLPIAYPGRSGLYSGLSAQHSRVSSEEC